MNSSDTTSLFPKKESNEFTLSHAMKHSNLVLLPQTFQSRSACYHIHPALRSILTGIQRHLKILSSSRPKMQQRLVRGTTPLVAFRRTDNLSDILFRSKLRTDKETNVTKGSFRCGKNCITCRYIADGRTNYTFSATEEMKTIHDRIDYNSENLIYMIHCLR